ncbi:hypothetical protein [Parachlamydia sp. AcF125]|uniref:hypothetical protein n=1 Tax=Parachlamydia sp. AcF125 TaxID=2795736 RepID=UPI001BC92938|nr:hypothetical protein [Parachlamydia sp. AcF125]
MPKQTLLIPSELKKWGNLDLNQGPAGYEGGGLRLYPVPSNLNQLDDSLFLNEKSTGFCWLVSVQYTKQCTFLHR